eukprot:GEMP01026140.1.p1 GENE.GEMP01026140.1~~GEMP01026140.1.p1  ORF type:complete len:765 (+),score=168.12 GEMP01026140.1:36-2330(+)
MALESAKAAAAPAKAAKPSECVKVVVRCRPMNAKETVDGRGMAVQFDTSAGVATITRPGAGDSSSKDFTYDSVYDTSATQELIYDETALDIVDSVMNGYNGTVFCYGQTGAGKSHTMCGPDGLESTPELEGLLPRSFKHIFQTIHTQGEGVKFLVRASYLEIYNEEVRDLLSKQPQKVELKDHPTMGVYVKDLSAFVVKGVDELSQVLDAGLKNRSVGATLMNMQSSRSHSIFTVTIETCEILSIDDEPHIRVGKLNMVDLAGSERQSKTGATGERLKEATKINLSLSALGNVISALVDGRSTHIPYRDSKLTRLLQDSLGGNTKTVMVANVGPADYNYEESLSTLRYAYRAKSIKNKPRINEDPKDAMIREFQDEIMRLKKQLSSAGGASRTEKVVVEKIKEVIVEKERIVNKGPTELEMKAIEQQLFEENQQVKKKLIDEKKRLEQEKTIALTEKDKLLTDLDKKERELEEQNKQQNQMIHKLKHMEDKMLIGSQVMEKALQQEDELRKTEKQLLRKKKAEERLQSQANQMQEENVDLREKFSSHEEETRRLTSKLEKLWNKYRRAQQEIVDIQTEFQTEQADLLASLRELQQDLEVKNLVINNYIPSDEAQALSDRAVWNPEDDGWVIEPINFAEKPLVRPKSALGLRMPMTEYARINMAMGDPNPRYRYENVLTTDLEMTERTTQYFDEDSDVGINEGIASALCFALAPDDAIDGYASPPGSPAPVGGERKKKKKKDRDSAERRKEDAFPQARGLVSRQV